MQELRSRPGRFPRLGLALRGAHTRLLPADRWLLAIGAACALRLALAPILIGTGLVGHNGWYFPNDDQVFFYGLARAIGHGAIITTPTTVGYSLFLVPFTAGTEFVLQAVPPVAVVQTLLAVPLAVLLYRSGTRLLDRRAAALGTALWLAYPVLLGPIFVSSYQPPFETSSNWMGLEISSDWAAGALVIVLLAVVSGSVSEASALRGAIAGLAGGAAFLVKPSNAIMLAAALAALVAWRRWRACAAALGSALVVAAPQLVYNHRLYGTATTFAYSHEFGRPDLVSLGNIPRSIGKLVVSNYTGPLLPLAAAGALVATWRRFPNARWLVVGHAVALTLFFAAVYYSRSPNFVRYLGTVMPLFALSVGAALVGRPGAAQSTATRPGKTSLALAAAALAGSIALAVWIAKAPPAPAVPTVESMRLTASVHGPDVRLQWHEPEAPAQLTYTVIRYDRAPRPSQFGFQGRGDGARPSAEIGGVRTGQAADRPGPGVWWYRVAITPYRERDHWTPTVTMGLSGVVRVVVPELVAS